MRLLYVFSFATAIVVAAVWALGEIGGWWLLAVAVTIHLTTTLGVIRTVLRTLSETGEPVDESTPRDAPAAPRARPYVRTALSYLDIPASLGSNRSQLSIQRWVRSNISRV
jgi:hypothetical protein